MVNYILAVVAFIIFFVFKYIEYKIIKKEPFNFKIVLRECIIVSFTVLISDFLFQQFEPLNDVLFKNPKVFIDEPSF